MQRTSPAAFHDFRFGATASAMACSAVTVMKAFSVGFSR